MKKTPVLLLLVLSLLPATGRALPPQPWPPSSPVSRPLLWGRLSHPSSRVEALLLSFDRQIIDSFREAWQRVGNGTSDHESVVLILKMADGGYSARLPNPTNEYKSFTFPWHPGAVAIVHTHPNRSQPFPADGDLLAAQKYNVPIFTITSSGMFVYEPSTGRISRVLDGLDWREDKAWEEMQTRIASHGVEASPRRAGRS